MSGIKFKAGHIMAVVFPPKDCPNEKAPDMLRTYLQGLLIGFPNAIGIIHQPEPTPLEEQDKFHHLHLIVYADVHNKDEWIESIVSLIHCDPVQVSVEAIANDTGALRYLVHADDKHKIQYDDGSVLYRNRSMLAEFKKALSARPEISIDDILACDSCEAVARLVGLKNYAAAIRVYRDINDEKDKKAKETVFLLECLRRIEDVYKYLCEVTAMPEYNRKGYIPLDKYQELLKFMSNALSDYHELYKMHRFDE